MLESLMPEKGPCGSGSRSRRVLKRTLPRTIEVWLSEVQPAEMSRLPSPREMDRPRRWAFRYWTTVAAGRSCSIEDTTRFESLLYIGIFLLFRLLPLESTESNGQAKALSGAGQSASRGYRCRSLEDSNLGHTI